MRKPTRRHRNTNEKNGSAVRSAAETALSRMIHHEAHEEEWKGNDQSELRKPGTGQGMSSVAIPLAFLPFVPFALFVVQSLPSAPLPPSGLPD
jgi:hypothetical protein